MLKDSLSAQIAARSVADWAAAAGRERVGRAAGGAVAGPERERAERLRAAAAQRHGRRAVARPVLQPAAGAPPPARQHERPGERLLLQQPAHRCAKILCLFILGTNCWGLLGNVHASWWASRNACTLLAAAEMGCLVQQPAPPAPASHTFLVQGSGQSRLPCTADSSSQAQRIAIWRMAAVGHPFVNGDLLRLACALHCPPESRHLL